MFENYNDNHYLQSIYYFLTYFWIIKKVKSEIPNKDLFLAILQKNKIQIPLKYILLHIKYFLKKMKIFQKLNPEILLKNYSKTIIYSLIYIN